MRQKVPESNEVGTEGRGINGKNRKIKSGWTQIFSIAFF
jgi:hypothetical protein